MSEVAVASRVVAFEMGLRMRNELLSERLGALKELGTAWRLERGHSSLSIYTSRAPRAFESSYRAR